MLESNATGEFMRTTIITTCLILSSLIVLDGFNAGHALMMLLLAGVVPGTNIVLSGSTMLEIYMVLIGFTLARVTLNLARLIGRATQSSKGTMLSAHS